MTGKEFSLRALAREVWDDLGGCDYHILAKETQRRVSAGDRDAALSEALVEFCRHYVTTLRPTLRPIPNPAPPASPTAPPQPPVSVRPRTSQRNSARSAKVAGIRQAWPQLRAHIFTKDGQKSLAQCTAADLIFHAELLERQAGQLKAKSSRERQLASLLRAHKVERVENLPDAVLGEYFAEDAAA